MRWLICNRLSDDRREILLVSVSGAKWQPRLCGHVPVINPATEETVAQIAAGSATDVDTAVDAARGAFPGFAAFSVETRAAFLDRIHTLILERAESFAQAISLEMGAAISYARSAQVPSAAAHVRVARDVSAATRS
jgi:aldehyde dehydrogenase (NAD+)